MYATAWECEYEKPVFDSDYKNLVTSNSHEITVRSDEAANEIRSTPGTIRENSPENIPQTDRPYDGADTDHYPQPDVNTSLGQPDPTLTNPRSSIYDLRHYPKPNCNFLSEVTTEHHRSSHTNFGLCIYWEVEFHHDALIYSHSVSGTNPDNRHQVDSGHNKENRQLILVFRGESFFSDTFPTHFSYSN